MEVHHRFARAALCCGISLAWLTASTRPADSEYIYDRLQVDAHDYELASGRMLTDATPSCGTSWAQLRTQLEARPGDYVKVTCPTSCSFGDVVGTGYYSDESDACGSLQHSQNFNGPLWVQFHGRARDTRFFAATQFGVSSLGRPGGQDTSTPFVSLRAALVTSPLTYSLYTGGARILPLPAHPLPSLSSAPQRASRVRPATLAGTAWTTPGRVRAAWAPRRCLTRPRNVGRASAQTASSSTTRKCFAA